MVLILTLVAGGIVFFLSALAVDLHDQGLLALMVLILLWKLDRLPRLGLGRIAFLTVAGFLLLRYLFWRTFTTLGFDDSLSFLASLLLYGAECYGLSMWFLSAVTNACPIRHSRRPQVSIWPSVDVFVPTYDEPVEIIKLTLTAVKALDYPPHLLKVYLLDDGATLAKRCAPNLAAARVALERYTTLKALCRKLGVTYLTRPDNALAKAGNLNAALQHAHGELIAVLDCDHVPAVDFLKQTVPHFADPKVFLVQTPHFFVTPDPIEKNLRLFDRMPAENAMFYQAVQLGMDFWNASFFCGSAAVLRRKALDEVGGFSGQTVTEDAETSLKLHAKGWRSVYLNQPLVAGLQPETFASLVRQRMRWAQGMVQLFLLHNPLRLKGLAFGQRLVYFNCAWFWFFPLARVVFLLAPLAYLLFGLKIYDANLKEIAAYTLPYLATLLLSAEYLFGRVRWALISEFYESMLSLFSFKAVVSTLKNPKTPRFTVTPKGERLDNDFISPLATPFYALLFLTSLGFIFALWRWQMLPQERSMILLTGIWNLVNFLILIASLGALYEQRQRRLYPRLPVANLPARLEFGQQSFPVRLRDVSVGGSNLMDVSMPLALEEQGYLSLEHPVLRCPLSLRVKIVDQSLKNKSVSVCFLPASLEEYRALVLLVYGDSQRWQMMLTKRQRDIGIVHALRILLACGFRQAAEHFVALWKFVLWRKENYVPVFKPRTRSSLEHDRPSGRIGLAFGEAYECARAHSITPPG
ncbi:MAG: UDP-forming cellulose synthase catalytic subunit [Methylohalobius sp.]|nr:UDP-forming cellulose synthase catalytic subunit [Methylohalobius sp.]